MNLNAQKNNTIYKYINSFHTYTETIEDSEAIV